MPKETWETIGETWGNLWGNGGGKCRELPLGGFLGHLVTSFQAASYTAGFTANDCQICLMNKSVYSGPFFQCFSPTHGILCKIYLNDGCWRVQISYFCLIISWRISRPHLDIGNVIKCLIICFVKTTCDCLTWIDLYKKLHYPWTWFIADLSFLGCFFCYCGEEQANWKNFQTEIFFDK